MGPVRTTPGMDCACRPDPSLGGLGGGAPQSKAGAAAPQRGVWGGGSPQDEAGVCAREGLWMSSFFVFFVGGGVVEERATRQGLRGFGPKWCSLQCFDPEIDSSGPRDYRFLGRSRTPSRAETV